jgi:PAS domain-containing protein
MSVRCELMERTKAKHLVLILARELAANVASAMVIVDPDGTLVDYNEPAEVLLGDSFSRTGEISIRSWAERYKPEGLNGEPYDIHRFPLARALREQRPSADTVRFTASDGVVRTVTVAAYPMLARSDEFVGAVALFWEPEGEGDAHAGEDLGV